MLMNWIIFGLLCLASTLGGNGVGAFDHEISEQRDHKVLLSCPIDFKACGELHSVKWFKGSSRIAVVSGDGEVASVTDEYMSRMSIDHLPKGPITSLSIKSLQIADEDVYTCESTFLEPRETCDTSGVFRIDLKVEVPPSAVHIIDESGKFVKNGTKYGPLREGHTLRSICEVKATRPVPTVAWYRGGKRLTDSLHVDEENGLFYVKSELLLIVSRLELGNNIECRVESPSLDDEIISNYLLLDLEVPPTDINLTGVEHHTVQGTNVLLQCKVQGARPAVTVSWFNATHEIDIRHNDAVQIETKSIEQRDGTYETVSDLRFVATRYEDGLKFRCEALNLVMRDRKDKPMQESLVLEVLYPPVVSVKPENLTVQEGKEVLLFCDYEANPATLQSVKWYENGKLVNLEDPNRYEGGNPESTALLIKKTTRFDDGVYTCELANNIGAEMSDNEIYLEVQFAPVVNLTMDPDTPMIENDEGNVTLYCNVLEGNPPTLGKVRWFLGGELLKELPECPSNGNDELCNIDPSKLLLQNIGRQFLGNYSCEGWNSAGWGARSKESELIVYYEPGNATIHHNPQIAVKRKSVNFTCSVDDAGFPEATTYHWLRGGRVVHEVTSNLYTVDPVGLDSRTNFTCYAFNAGGNGNSATVLLDVHAAPTFINALMPYTGVLYSTNNASLTCRVECVPECSISWFKDGVGIDNTSDKYYISQKYLEAEPATGDFESVLSVLNFNMSAWPQGKFDIYGDNANYSCVSTNNSAGLGVRSATYFGIEYPPENTTVSKDVVTVEEDNIPERILCTAKGNPEPLYEWQFNGSTVTRGSALIINHKMAKSDAGGYECIAFNKHGRLSAVTNITVTYKPTCEIIRKEIDDEDTLICTAIGNPKEASFQWSIKSENDSTEVKGGITIGESNYLVLDDEFSESRIYRCVANNSVGAGPYCEIEVAGHLSWWQRWDKITMIILVASVLGVLLAVIVLCCVIVCICRRRRRRDKCGRDNEDRPPPLPKRNLLPSSRNSTNVNNISECSTNELLPRKCKKRRNRSSLAPDSDNEDEVEDTSVRRRPLQVAFSDNQPQDRLSDHNPGETDGTTNRGGAGLFERIFGEIFSRPTESGRSRGEAETSSDVRSNNFRDRLRNIFGPTRIFRRQRLERSDSGASNPFATEHRLKGIRCSGVITYMKTPASNLKIASSSAVDRTSNYSSPTAVIAASSRDEPNNNVNNKSSALGDPLTEPGEYENLPFHGLQTAPNKFATTPSINFNNSNVVRVAPRPKQVTNNNTNNTSSYALHQQQSHYPLTQSTLLKQSYPLSTSQTLLLSSSGANSGHGGVNSNSAGNMTNCSTTSASTGNGGGGGHSRQYSLSNCFPTSYTAYYQQQQQQKGSISKNSIVDNSFASNCPYTVQNQSSSTSSQNPFVVQNLRKFNTNSGCRQSGTHRKKPPDPEKKFYSLKSLGNRKGGGLHFCSIKPSLSSSKCKRHHSFAGGSVGDIVTSGNCIGPTQHTLPFVAQHHQQTDASKMKFYEPPLYENLTDSIQIHESSLGGSHSHNTHGQHSHANGDVNNLMEPERLSIYRSDSGISNSSYECVTPVPAPRQLLKQKSSSSSHSQSKCQNHSPLYMNVTDNSRSTGRTSPSQLPSSSSSLSQQPQQHVSAATNSNHPSCLNASSNFNSSNSSSSNGNGSHCNGANKCNQPNNNNSKDTMQLYCQRQPQQHPDLKQHHPQQNQQQLRPHELQHAKHGSSNRSRCKKRAQNSASLVNLEHVSNTNNNPFLAAGTSSSSGFNSLNEQGGGASSSSSSSTTTNRCRPKSSHHQQILVPKDHSQLVSLNATTTSSLSSPSSKAFKPVSNHHKTRISNKHTNSARIAANSYSSNYNSDNNLTDTHHYNADSLQSHSYHKSNGYIIRPMKLPLRKHHSFHFQSSQTVAGSSSHKSSKHNPSSSVCAYRANYKTNGGPLVFKPLLNENSSFKPITPANGSNCNGIDREGSKTPRICGTSLKRHMSNVESYDGSRYRKHSLSSPGLNIKDDELSGNEDDDEDNIGIDDEDDEDIDEIIITQEEDPPSSSSNSTIVGKRLVYADLASLTPSGRSTRNLRAASSTAGVDSHSRDRPIVHEFDDLTINSDSEQFRRTSRLGRPLPYVGPAESGGYETDRAYEAAVVGTPIKRRAQYASLKYNEVNI